MPSLRDYIGQEMTWVPTATFKSRFDLVVGDTILASLDMSDWTSKATATVPEGMLMLQLEGFARRNASIYVGEQGAAVATYQRKWTGTSGTLQFPDGRQLKWVKTNFWGTEKAWRDQSGMIDYVQFHTGSFSRKVQVTISPQAAEIPELSLLLVLGLYNIIIERRDAAAASVSTASVAH